MEVALPKRRVLMVSVTYQQHDFNVHT